MHLARSLFTAVVSVSGLLANASEPLLAQRASGAAQVDTSHTEYTALPSTILPG